MKHKKINFSMIIFCAVFMGASFAQAASRIKAVKKATVPAAPTGLTAKQTASKIVQLNWNADATATAYQVYRSVSNGSGGWNTIEACSTTTALTCNDTTFASGSTDYY